MAVNYRTTLKNARLQAVIDDIGAGVAGAIAIAGELSAMEPADGLAGAGLVILAGGLEAVEGGDRCAMRAAAIDRVEYDNDWLLAA